MRHLLVALSGKWVYTCVRKDVPKHGIEEYPIMFDLVDEYSRCINMRLMIQNAFEEICKPRARFNINKQVFYPNVTADQIMNVFNELGMELRFNPHQILSHRPVANETRMNHMSSQSSDSMMSENVEETYISPTTYSEETFETTDSLYEMSSETADQNTNEGGAIFMTDQLTEDEMIDYISEALLQFHIDPTQ